MSKRRKRWNVQRAYEFIKAHRHEYEIKTMCSPLEISRAGYYIWPHEPLSNRAKENVRLLRLIRVSYKSSHGVYGLTRIFLNLREAGETCSKHRIARIVNRLANFAGRMTQIILWSGVQGNGYWSGKPAGERLICAGIRLK